MPKLFPSTTHCIVRTVKKEADMKEMFGTMAFVDICFGPGDAHALRYIGIKKMTGPVSGVTAHIPKTPVVIDGKKIWISVFEGTASDEVKMLALVAFDRVKQQYGLKFNKTYRVLAKTVEECE